MAANPPRERPPTPDAAPPGTTVDVVLMTIILAVVAVIAVAALSG